MQDQYPLFNSEIFRKCEGWTDRSERTHLAAEHEEYFLIPPLEQLMPKSVPVRKRCDACIKDRHRFLVRMRVRRYRMSKLRVNTLAYYNKVLQMHKDGKVRLSNKLILDIEGKKQLNGG